MTGRPQLVPPGGLYDALASGDELAARAVVDRLDEGGIEPLDLLAELFTPVLRRIGERWASGDLSIAQEHRATAMCERLLARIAVHPRGRPRGVAVVATMPDDDHALPATMAAVALRADLWQVHHLGAGVPVDELVAFSSTLPGGWSSSPSPRRPPVLRRSRCAGGWGRAHGS